MRSKHPSRTRTRTHSREQHQQSRAWGTRFDYLDTSPPPAQSSSPVPSPATSPTPADSSEQLTHALSLELFGANSKASEKRDWADDDVPSTVLSPGRTPLILNLASGTTHGRKDIAKQPHNASVFVGSLPPGIDEAEMAQLLAQHLSRFASVQNIKIVRDSKGGLCAFVQCENATQATQLVSQAQANPQPFMGRHLRYENARARRTLWISYRIPTHFMPCASKDEEGPDIVIDENGMKGRWIESDLPDALRIWKPRDVRFPIVTFRGEARNIGDASRLDKDASASDIAPAFRHKGVLFTDMKFDVQMVRIMAEAFGPLETFKTLIGNDTVEELRAYPAGHDIARSRGMDPCVWEIKWEHRDDCITALNTLRRIPFLTVTWAKDCGLPQTPHVGFLHLRTPTSPRYPTSYTSREAISPVARGRPYLLLDCKPRDDGEFSNAGSPVVTPSFVHSANELSPKKAVEQRRKDEPAHCIPEDDTDEGWTVVRSQNVTRTIGSSLSENTSGSPMVEETKSKVPDWNEGDFPPLKTERPRPEVPKPTEGKSETSSSSAFVSLNDPAPLNPEDEETSAHNASPQGDSPAPRPQFVHRRSLSNPVAFSQVQVSRESPNAQRLEIPPTPELADSSLTQTPTSAQPELVSPNYPTLVPLTGSDQPVHEQKMSEQRHTQDVGSAPSESDQSATGSIGTGRYDHRRQMTVDPKTVFVGGLEPFGPRLWDESRLREIFGKYGAIQEIRVVSPSSKKAGFAFVTFVDEQSTEKAICEEHNRFYDGRQIRVQIRDMFPQRNTFKFRGRGFNRRSFGFDLHRDGTRHRCSTEPIDRNSSLMSNGIKPFDHHFTYTRGVDGNTVNAPFQINPRAAQQLVPSTSIGTDSSTLRSLSSFDSKTEVDLSHESESKTAASVSPPPSTLNASVSTTGLSMPITPQAMPSTQPGYYQPYAWMMPYGAQVHYPPMTYGTVGGVVPSGPSQFTSASQSADPNVVPASVPVPWNPMYKTTVPFAPYSYIVMAPTDAEMPHSAGVASQPATPVKGQPPLHAAGFIQGEHGILFPVYQPEALNDYMNSSSPTPNTTANRAPTVNSVSSTSGQHQPKLVPAPVWHGFAHAPQFIPYPVASASATGTNPSATPTTAFPQHSNLQQMHGRPSPVATTARGSYTMPFITDLTHSLPVQDQSTAFTPSGASAPGIPPPYFVGVPPSTAATATRVPYVGFQGSHSVHARTPERLNMYSNKHPSRRDLAFHQGRNAQYGRAQGPAIPSARPPSGARSTSGPVNSAHADHQSNHLAQQRQRQASAAPPLELGFNKYTQDNGHSHQHQWIANFEK